MVYWYSIQPPHKFEGVFKPLTEDDNLAQYTNLTDIEPLPPSNNPHIVVCFDPEKKEWFYKEEYNRLLCETNTLDDILDYKALRQMEYPPEADYLDAQAKADDTQLLAYFRACRAVKARYPKDFKPISRRNYLVKKIGLRTDKEVQEWEYGVEGVDSRYTTLSELDSELGIVKEGMDNLKQDIDTLKVARTLAKSEIGKVKASVTSLARQVDALPAFEAMKETESIKTNLATTNERLTTLQATVDSIVSALKRRYIM